MPSGTKDLFRGSDIEAWISHFNPSDELKQILVDKMGVTSVEDFTIYVTDDELIEGLRRSASKSDFENFFTALTKTANSEHPHQPILSETDLQQFIGPVISDADMSEALELLAPDPNDENIDSNTSIPRVNMPSYPVPMPSPMPLCPSLPSPMPLTLPMPSSMPLPMPSSMPSYLSPSMHSSMPPYFQNSTTPYGLSNSYYVPSSHMNTTSLATPPPFTSQLQVKSNSQPCYDTQNEIEKRYQIALQEKEKLDKKAKIGSRRVDKVFQITVLKDKDRHDSTEVDIAFVLDCTGSMGAYLKALRDHIQSFVAAMKMDHPRMLLRIAFIGYKDFDSDGHILVQNFTTDLEELESVLSGQKAEGGGDDAEDVLGGLEAAVTNIEWKAKNRLLYLICDAPCHGAPFHDEDCSDNYPDEESSLAKAKEVFRMLRDLNVSFFFGKICTKTKMMIETFNSIAGEPYPYITEIPLQNSSAMIEIITESVNKTYTSFYLDPSEKKENVKRHDLTLDPTKPDFKAIDNKEKVMKFPMTLPASLEELLSEQVDRCVSDFPESAPLEVKLARAPFAKGGLRFAYYGQLFPANEPKDVVFKECLPGSKSGRSKHDYEKFLICHRAARFFSDEFEKIRPAHCPQIHYVDAHIVQRNECWPEQPILIYEEAIVGEFEKYNSNTGYVAPFPTEKGVNHEAVQAFSHWTHAVSKGCMIVVDCQGGYDVEQNKFLLTDPAVHCVDVKRFGRTNLGEKGFEKFYRSHVCNPYCKALGLIRPMFVMGR